MKLWANEAFRVFHDRLINDDDREWFVTYSKDLIGKNFKLPCDDDTFNTLRYGDLLRLDSPV